MTFKPPPLRSEQREELMLALQATRDEIEQALALLGQVGNAGAASALVAKAIAPALKANDALLEEMNSPARPPPLDEAAETHLQQDARTLQHCAEAIWATVRDPAALDAARRGHLPMHDWVETAFVATINLRDFAWPTWPRVERAHLAVGYEVVAAQRYVLYGEHRFGPAALPTDMHKFPQRLS
ncbi:hypothetical protein [Deinococcus sp. Leaf326]|uniref:hypothetical protein n=1 Tax=Deinococcus sp. Leaf326 TaxID=1736338 RepID=UPI0006F74739|nr:hypothetical protein [Deinococcus sp. Leaf326]KQQ99302.1 hypothetical protein ASF71_21940 [Deinococcus sp. Leaf326]